MKRYCLPMMAALYAVTFLGCNDRTPPSVEAPERHGKHAHYESTSTQKSPQMILSTNPEQPHSGSEVEVKIMLHDSTGQMLKDFELTHEKMAHLIVVREGLDEFAHLHPDVEKSGVMAVKHQFSRGGRYLIYLDYKPVGKPSATAYSGLVIEGGSPAAEALVPNVPGKVLGNGLQAEVTMKAPDSTGQLVTYEVQDESGSAVKDLQPYLGAMGHLVVLSADGTKYVHAHPLTQSSRDGKVEFEVHFPQDGIYKAWAQFRRNNEVFTVPAVFKVESLAHH